MPIPIQELINKSLKRREKKEITSWHISKLGSCLRGIYFERLGVKPDTPLDDRTLRVFDMGNKVERWIIDLIEAHQINMETQVRVEDKKLGVSGYADAVIEYDGEKEVLEIKSKHSRSFWWMDKKGEGAQRQHQYQIWTYLYLLNIAKGSIIYISKDDLAILQYPILLNNKELKKEVMEELRLLNLAWEKKDTSVLPLYDEKDWRSKYCRYHTNCLKVKK